MATPLAAGDRVVVRAAAAVVVVVGLEVGAQAAVVAVEEGVAPASSATRKATCHATVRTAIQAEEDVGEEAGVALVSSVIRRDTCRASVRTATPAAVREEEGKCAPLFVSHGFLWSSVLMKEMR